LSLKLWWRGSGIVFTIDVYNHIIEWGQSDAMALLAEVLTPAVNGVKITPI